MHDVSHPKQCLPFCWVSARSFAFFACNGILPPLCCVNCQDLDNGLCNIVPTSAQLSTRAHVEVHVSLLRQALVTGACKATNGNTYLQVLE